MRSQSKIPPWCCKVPPWLGCEAFSLNAGTRNTKSHVWFVRITAHGLKAMAGHGLPTMAIPSRSSISTLAAEGVWAASFLLECLMLCDLHRHFPRDQRVKDSEVEERESRSRSSDQKIHPVPVVAPTPWLVTKPIRF